MIVACLSTRAAAQVVVATVPVGDTASAADQLTGGLYGSVVYTCGIGTHEVTNGQCTSFLNAIAAADTNGLYSTGMDGAHGGISRSGSAGSYTDAAVNGRADNPVTNVGFQDADRFAIWLHHGQPAGAQNNSETEDGAYAMTPGGISSNTVSHSPGWRWAVTSEDEWHKAAYYQPAAQGGDLDGYWLYPTSGNAIGTGQANYNRAVGDTTPVGSYHPELLRRVR